MNRVEQVFFSQNNFTMLGSLIQDNMTKQGTWTETHRQHFKDELLHAMRNVFTKNMHMQVDIPISQANMILNKEVLQAMLQVPNKQSVTYNSNQPAHIPPRPRSITQQKQYGMSVGDAFAIAQKSRQDTSGIIRTGVLRLMRWLKVLLLKYHLPHLN